MKILITGGTGLVGTALQEIFKNTEHKTLFLSSKDCDLTNYNEAKTIFKPHVKAVMPIKI